MQDCGLRPAKTVVKLVSSWGLDLRSEGGDSKRKGVTEIHICRVLQPQSRCSEGIKSFFFQKPHEFNSVGVTELSTDCFGAWVGRGCLSMPIVLFTVQGKTQEN